VKPARSQSSSPPPADEEGSPVYRYKITDEAAGIDHEARIYILGRDCARTTRGPPRHSSASCMGANEAYLTELEGNIDSENLDLLPAFRAPGHAYALGSRHSLQAQLAT
jgi:hypothetical protein